MEDGTVSGGFGSAILEFMAAHHYSAQVTILGIPDQVIEHGTPKQLQHEAGFDGEAIANSARAMLKESLKGSFLTN